MLQRLQKESNLRQCILHDADCFSSCFYNTGSRLTGRYSQLVETLNPVTSAAVPLVVGICLDAAVRYSLLMVRQIVTSELCRHDMNTVVCSETNATKSSASGSNPLNITPSHIERYSLNSNRLCGLVVRVSGYRYRCLGIDSRRYQIF